MALASHMNVDSPHQVEASAPPVCGGAPAFSLRSCLHIALALVLCQLPVAVILLDAACLCHT